MVRRADPPEWTPLTFGLGLMLKAVAVYFLVGLLWTHRAGRIGTWTLLGRCLIVAAMVSLGAAITRWAWRHRVSSREERPWT